MNKQIDESLYSRQLYVIGKDAMEKMMRSKILVIGLDGLGQEIVKNLCLTGVSQIFIYDPSEITEDDFSTGFYFSKNNLGRKKDESLLMRFRSLNEYVSVHILEDISSFTDIDLVISCNEQVHSMIKINKLARRDNSKFIGCQSRGVFSQIFCDFGTDFICVDTTGEAPVIGMINDISSEGILTVVDEQRHNLEDGDIIKIIPNNSKKNMNSSKKNMNSSKKNMNSSKKNMNSSKKNMNSSKKNMNSSKKNMNSSKKNMNSSKKNMNSSKKNMNSSKKNMNSSKKNMNSSKKNMNSEGEDYEGILFRIKGLNKSQIQLSKIDGSSILESDFSNIKEMPFNFTEMYGGDFEQVKRPKLFNFKMLEDSLNDPKIQFSESDFTHKCFIALSEYTEKYHSLPNEDQFVSFYIKKYNSQNPLLKFFGRQCDTSFMPLCSVVGGFVAQEALKGISYKFTPLVQFMYYDASELCMDFVTKNKSYGRYNFLYKIFGEEAVKTLFNLKIFLVGSGAIGCEHLKNLVMTGISSEGILSVTDMDSIEQSNLNRQFLFSKDDVGKMKAEVAISKIPYLNEEYTKNSINNIDNCSNVNYYNLKVGEETESVFSDKFFSNLDFVLNALDNVEARVYTDERCVLHRKPLVDAGTSGTKGNVQVVVPLLSESYGSSRDPPEKSIPLCTIKNFPHAIEHTIEWAMSEFRLKFHDQIVKLKDNEEDEDLNELRALSPRNIEECIRLGLRLFIKYFHTSIQELLKTFPPDSLTKEGQPFWMPPKRSPEAINLDINNDLHITFIRSAANIYSDIYNINKKKVDSNEMVDKMDSNEKVDNNINTKINNNKKVYEKVNNSFVREFIISELENIDVILEKNETEEINYSLLTPMEFEKDNDSNNHVDFIYACSNLRAQNYKIKNQDKLAIKKIAGRIIPAIATTTAVVSGLSIIEMIKVVLKLGKYKNSFLNLALPYFGYSDPLEAEKYFYILDNKKYYFTMWNRLEYKNTQLKNIIKAFEIQFKTQISMLTIDNKLLYWDIDSKYDHNLTKLVSELVDKREGRRLVVVDLATDSERDEYPRIVVLIDE